MKYDIPGVIGFSLTIAKVLLSLIIVHCLFHSEVVWAAGLILFFIVCDILDGMFFRQSVMAHNPVLCRIRRVFDVVGDRFAIVVVSITAIAVNSFPFIFWLIILSRELSLGGVLYYKRRKGKEITEPNNWGRIGTVFIGFTIIFWLLSNPVMSICCLVGMWFFGAISLWKYYHLE